MLIGPYHLRLLHLRWLQCMTMHAEIAHNNYSVRCNRVQYTGNLQCFSTSTSCFRLSGVTHLTSDPYSCTTDFVVAGVVPVESYLKLTPLFIG